MDNKTLIDRLAATPDTSRDDVVNLLQSLTDIIADHCSEMDSIAVPGFGSFEPKKRLERIATHPSTGRRMIFPPKITLSFKPSNLLKQKIAK